MSAKIILLDPLGRGRSFLGHRHFMRDWSGFVLPGSLPLVPLDQLYAAAYLRKYGYDVKVVEASIKHWTHRKVVKIIQEELPDFVLIPSTYFGINDDKYLARLIKDSVPSVKIIFSGPGVTFDPSIVLSEGYADFVALGDLELPLLNIIKGNYVENIAYIDNGKIIIKERKLLDLNELVVPARDLIDNNAYRYAIFNRRNPATAMTVSRGCPHSKCKFCHSPLYSLGVVRYRNINSIIEEINEVVFKYKIGEIFFRDQAFTANREFVYRICEHLIANRIDIAWRCTTRADLVDKELLLLMQKAGCYQISYGFESNSQISLDKINKAITIQQSIQAARYSKEAGIEVVGLFICGLPGDTKSSLSNLVGFANDLDVDYAQFDEFFFIPSTASYDEHYRDKSEYLSNFFIKKSAILSYLKFYFTKKNLLRKLKRIKSIRDIYFLLKMAIDELLAHT
ncbi:MAG: radical SAM protein [Candidatus Omnitrophota bacterium]